MKRRAFLALLAAGVAVPGGMRVVSLDYGLAQTALAVGGDLVGVPDPVDYRVWVVTPAMPAAVQDLGQRTQPNLDVLHDLRPGLILAIQDHAPIRTLLEAIAPVLELPIYTPERRPWDRSVEAARAIGGRVGRPAAAERLVADVSERFAAGRAALAGRAQRPILLASFIDPRHLSIYGAGGILHDALERLGLRNAWRGTTGRWGSVTVPLESLAGLGEAALFLIEPLPPDLDGVLGRSPLWQALPFVRAGRVFRLDPVLMFGTLPAADRFCELLLPHLLDGAARA